MSTTQTISATEFKAKCLDILDRLGSRELERVEVTKRGRVMAVLTPPPATAEAVANIHGFMKGRAIIAPDLDLTEPVLDEPFLAESGLLHY